MASPSPARSPTRILPLLVVVVAALAIFSLVKQRSTPCNIKGNISLRTGEKIYHVPGGEFYDLTEIHRDRGERWFCSEAEARSAGWRRSYR